MHSHSCPSCKSKIPFIQVVKYQYKKELECNNCHKKLDFRINKLFLFIVMMISLVLPNLIYVRLPYALLMIIFFLPVTSLYFGFIILKDKTDKYKIY